MKKFKHLLFIILIINDSLIIVIIIIHKIFQIKILIQINKPEVILFKYSYYNTTILCFSLYFYILNNLFNKNINNEIKINKNK